VKVSTHLGAGTNWGPAKNLWWPCPPSPLRIATGLQQIRLIIMCRWRTAKTTWQIPISTAVLCHFRIVT